MIILCSKSPRRKELLSGLFGDINIQAQNTDENYHSVRPSYVVREIAKSKLDGVIVGDDDVAISADTLVYFRGEYLGKPKDKHDAKRMLSMLSGNTHSVYTGVAIRYKGKVTVFYDKSQVKFKRLGEKDIDDYILSGSPMDKAGSYGIQDKWLIDSFTGSYDNILGLPTEKLVSVLKKLGVVVKCRN